MCRILNESKKAKKQNKTTQTPIPTYTFKSGGPRATRREIPRCPPALSLRGEGHRGGGCQRREERAQSGTLFFVVLFRRSLECESVITAKSREIIANFATVTRAKGYLECVSSRTPRTFQFEKSTNFRAYIQPFATEKK